MGTIFRSHMKKAALVVLGLLIVGAGVFLAIRSWRMRTFSERVFPEDTIVYAQVADLRQAGHGVERSQLGKAIAESPRRDVYVRLGERLAQSVESLIGADPRPVLHRIHARRRHRHPPAAVRTPPGWALPRTRRNPRS